MKYVEYTVAVTATMAAVSRYVHIIAFPIVLLLQALRNTITISVTVR
jgi:hypothetical protein